MIALWVQTRHASRKDLGTGEPRRSQIIGEVIDCRGYIGCHLLEKLVGFTGPAEISYCFIAFNISVFFSGQSSVIFSYPWPLALNFY